MSSYLERLAERKEQGLLYGPVKSDSSELVRGAEYRLNEFLLTYKAAIAPEYGVPLIKMRFESSKVKYQNTSIIKDDGMLYQTGELLGLMAIPLVIASLVVLFKRFRTKKIFLNLSIGLLWIMAAIQAFGLSVLGENIGAYLGKVLIVTGLFFLIAHIKDVFLWLKKEII